MATTLGIIITDAGIAEVVNAEHSGTAPVTLTQVGFGSGQYTPTPDQTALHNEIKRVDTIAGGVVGSDILHIQALDGSPTDSYTVYEIGVYTASGTLFAVYSQNLPIIHKIADTQTMVAIDIVLSGFQPSSVTIGDTDFSLAPATTSNLGVVELATNAEATAGTDDERAVTPAALSAALTAAKQTLAKLDNDPTPNANGHHVVLNDGGKFTTSKTFGNPSDTRKIELDAAVGASGNPISSSILIDTNSYGKTKINENGISFFPPGSSNVGIFGDKDANNNPVLKIAKYLTGAGFSAAALKVLGTIEATSDLTVSGDAIVNNDLTVHQDASVDGIISAAASIISGNESIGGNLTVTGNISTANGTISGHQITSDELIINGSGSFLDVFITGTDGLDVTNGISAGSVSTGTLSASNGASITGDTSITEGNLTVSIGSAMDGGKITSDELETDVAKLKTAIIKNFLFSSDSGLAFGAFWTTSGPISSGDPVVSYELPNGSGTGETVTALVAKLDSLRLSKRVWVLLKDTGITNIYGPNDTLPSNAMYSSYQFGLVFAV